MTVPDLVLCVPSPFGKPLFVLNQLFAFSFSGSFLSARPAPYGGGGGGCWDWMGYGWGLGWTAWWVPVAGCVAPMSLGSAGPGGFGDHASVCPSPPPPPSAHGQDLWTVPTFACLPSPPPQAVRDLSSCLVSSPSDQGGDSCNYCLPALVSVTLWVVLPPLALFGV